MRTHRVRIGISLFAALFTTVCLFGADVSMTLDEQEQFLLTAEVVKRKRLSEGITGSVRATLSDGSLTHDA